MFLRHQVILACLLLGLPSMGHASAIWEVVPPAGLSPDGGIIEIQITFGDLGDPSSLGLALDLPVGWSYASDIGTAAVKPVEGETTSTLGWAWFSGFPAVGSSMLISLNYPSGLAEEQLLDGRLLIGEVSDPFIRLNLLVREDPVLEAPLDIIASDGDFSDRVTLSWSASSGAESYTLYRSESEDSSLAEELASSIVSTSFDDLSAAPDVTYFYWVKAVSADLISEFGLSNAGFAFREKIATSWALAVGSDTLSIDGGTVEILLTVGEIGIPSSLGFEIDLPAGWSFVGDDSNAPVRPTPGETTSILGWAWFTGFPTLGETLSVRVSYPEGLSRGAEISGRFFPDGATVDFSLLPIPLGVPSRINVEVEGVELRYDSVAGIPFRVLHSSDLLNWNEQSRGITDESGQSAFVLSSALTSQSHWFLVLLQ